MIIEGDFTLKAPIKEVWDFLLEPGTLASCIPGAEKVERLDDRTYESVVKQKVGPISATLRFTTRLAELEPPRHIRAIGQGEEVHKAGTFSQETTITLSELGSDEVRIAYRSDVRLVGRLATFGERILRAKVKSVGDEFVRNLQEKLKSWLQEKGGQK